jgi:hypothetical protein
VPFCLWINFGGQIAKNKKIRGTEKKREPFIRALIGGATNLWFWVCNDPSVTSNSNKPCQILWWLENK